MLNNYPPPAARLKNYREFSGDQLTPEELRRVFNGNPTFLRRLYQATLPQQHPQHMPNAAPVPLGAANG